MVTPGWSCLPLTMGPGDPPSASTPSEDSGGIRGITPPSSSSSSPASSSHRPRRIAPSGMNSRTTFPKAVTGASISRPSGSCPNQLRSDTA